MNTAADLTAIDGIESGPELVFESNFFKILRTSWVSVGVMCQELRTRGGRKSVSLFVDSGSLEYNTHLQSVHESKALRGSADSVRVDY